MNILLYYVIPFVIVLGILIFFHELGHFLVAKYFGVKILKFSLGFGPKIVGRQIGETEYLISALPLGGYVKMLGEGEEDEPVEQKELQRSFAAQHPLKRMAIVAAGPMANLLLAALIFCPVYMVSGLQVMTPEIGQITEGSPAQKAGFLKGDTIVAIGDMPTETWSEVKAIVEKSAGIPLRITVMRAGTAAQLTVVPQQATVRNLFGEEISSGIIGVVAAGKYKTISLGPLEAIGEGLKKTWEIIRLTCLTVVKLIQRIVPIKTLGGPIMIGQMTGQLAQESWTNLLPFMAVISINLGILNLLPVPILDGGLLIFLLIELVTGKTLSLRKRELAQKAGLFLLILLMAIVMYNDLVRLVE
ncbi:MAG: RIP metalloprotease RseP [Desulfobacteraceae bacterium]|nr:MAG: RIP metalloprotease RseP [Desulfobacteraceae bacterium]